MKPTDNTNVLARLRARAEGVIKDRANSTPALAVSEEIIGTGPFNPARAESPPPLKTIVTSVATPMQQGELFHRSKRANDGIVTRFTDDEILDKRRDIAAAEVELNMNISMSDHNRICHNFFKRNGTKITKEMVLEVWATDRRRHKRTSSQDDRMS
jgi:hypothetical protein